MTEAPDHEPTGPGDFTGVASDQLDAGAGEQAAELEQAEQDPDEGAAGEDPGPHPDEPDDSAA